MPSNHHGSVETRRPDAPSTGHHYYGVESTGPVDVFSAAIDALGTMPTITFKTTGHGIATIKVTYSIYVDPADDPDDPDDATNQYWEDASETLMLKVRRVS